MGEESELPVHYTQCFSANTKARAVYEKLGYREEIVKYVKLL